MAWNFSGKGVGLVDPLAMFELDLDGEGKRRARQARITISSTRPCNQESVLKYWSFSRVAVDYIWRTGACRGSRGCQQKKMRVIRTVFSPVIGDRYLFKSASERVSDVLVPKADIGGERRTGTSPTRPPQLPSTHATAPAHFEVEASPAPQPGTHRASPSAQGTHFRRNLEADPHSWASRGSC